MSPSSHFKARQSLSRTSKLIMVALDSVRDGGIINLGFIVTIRF